jgi:hypothetical protein
LFAKEAEVLSWVPLIPLQKLLPKLTAGWFEGAPLSFFFLTYNSLSVRFKLVQKRILSASGDAGTGYREVIRYKHDDDRYY